MRPSRTHWFELGARTSTDDCRGYTRDKSREEREAGICAGLRLGQLYVGDSDFGRPYLGRICGGRSWVDDDGLESGTGQRCQCDTNGK